MYVYCIYYIYNISYKYNYRLDIQYYPINGTALKILGTVTLVDSP